MEYLFFPSCKYASESGATTDSIYISALFINDSIAVFQVLSYTNLCAQACSLFYLGFKKIVLRIQ